MFGCLSCSVHEGETLFVLLRLLSCQLLLQTDFVLLAIVVVQSWLDMNSAGHHTSQRLSQGVDLQRVDCSIEGIDFLGVESSDKFSKFFVDMVFQDVVFEFRRFFNVVLHGFENFENELECFLVDIGDGGLDRMMVTVCPFSMASASSMYFMAATCC